MKELIIHAHFYQPFRENPYFGEIPLEESAYPFEHWNERIYRECYLPVAYAHYREGSITKDIINCYAHLSFNMGWTLFNWIEKFHPELVEKIREGASHTLATSFNHTILPLDPPEDQEVQIFWGIRAYEKFFGRKPKGFWLPELAVDEQTLEILKKYGIEFIVLAPHQVSGNGNYLKVNELAVFVYDGELSHGVSFGDLLWNAEKLYTSMIHKKPPVIIATDGETFGHHKKFGELALAYLFKKHSKNFTTMDDYYRHHKPIEEGKLIPYTSWSCVHGVERWRSDCGCSTGGLPGWHQKWRKPLREGLEAVRSAVKEKAYNLLEKYFTDPRLAVLHYVDVILNDYSEKSKDNYLKEHAKRSLSKPEKIELFKTLHALTLMQFAFSSDGWFFADISGIETVKNLLYAKRAIDLMELRQVEEVLKQYLAEAPSNLIEYGNGLGVWNSLVKTQVYQPDNVAHTALFLYMSDVKEKKDKLGFWNFTVEDKEEKFFILLKDRITEQEFSFEFGWNELYLERLPPSYLKMVLDRWVETFENSYLNFVSDHIYLLEEIKFYAKSKSFKFKDVKTHLELLFKLRLKKLLNEYVNVESIKSILQRAEELDLELDLHELKDSFIKFCLKKLDKEEELLEMIELIKDYNRKVGKFELMIDLWEVQNAVWERRKNIKDKRILNALNLQPDAIE
ncbi:DUF3536 domain-containing protein [Thermocrinis sp.]